MQFRSLIEHLKPPRGFRLTGAGKIFFIFLFGVSVAALLTGNNLLFLILAVLLTFMIVSGIESEWNIRHIQAQRLLPTEIYAGITARIRYLVTNPRNRSRRLILSDIDAIRIPNLEKGCLIGLENESVFASRGRHAMGNIIIRTTFPYGLFEKSITFAAGGELIVFPRPLKVEPRYINGIEGAGAGPEHESVSHIRPYVPGDPLAGIIWKRLHKGLFSRVMEGGAGHAGIVVLTPGGNLEDKLSRATWLIGEFSASGRPYGLWVNDYYSGLAKGTEHKTAILQKLALLDAIREPQARNIDEGSPFFRL